MNDVLPKMLFQTSVNGASILSNIAYVLKKYKYNMYI